MSELGWQAWVTLAVVGATLFVLVRDLLAPALAILFADIVLLITGVITADEAFAGFSNPAPITMAALFVVARVVETTAPSSRWCGARWATETAGDGSGRAHGRCRHSPPGALRAGGLTGRFEVARIIQLCRRT